MRVCMYQSNYGEYILSNETKMKYFFTKNKLLYLLEYQMIV